MALPNQHTLKRTRDPAQHLPGRSQQNRQDQLADVMAQRRQLLEKHQAKRAVRHAAVREPAEEHTTLKEGLEA
jgi:shikimate kinase